MAVSVVVALGLVGLVGGIGITAVGPGGVRPTIGLFTLTGLSPAVVAGLGFVVAVVSGVVGIGGPMLTVPLLVALGVPVLESLAAAQAQSVVIAGVGTVG